jgi:hypothetical protein
MFPFSIHGFTYGKIMSMFRNSTPKLDRTYRINDTLYRDMPKATEDVPMLKAAERSFDPLLEAL